MVYTGIYIIHIRCVDQNRTVMCTSTPWHVNTPITHCIFNTTSNERFKVKVGGGGGEPRGGGGGRGGGGEIFGVGGYLTGRGGGVEWGVP